MGSTAETTIHRAVVTGPTGAVGMALINELVENGIEVIAVPREGSRRLGAIPSSAAIRVVECSMNRYEALPSLIGESCDAFFHLAWDGTFGASRQDWKRQARNVESAVDAVDAAAMLGCKVFVGAGSQSEFGHVEGIMHPDMPCRPDNGYGAAKLAACEMTRALCDHLGIRQNWCRIISLYGLGDSDRTLISQAIHAFENHEHFSCTKGDQIWDYIYSKDAARAFRLVANKGVHGEIYCLGTGRTRRLRKFIESIRDILDPGAEIGFGEIEYYQNQVMHLEADISNLTEDTGFIPGYTFEAGIREMVATNYPKQ